MFSPLPLPLPLSLSLSPSLSLFFPCEFHSYPTKNEWLCLNYWNTVQVGFCPASSYHLRFDILLFLRGRRTTGTSFSLHVILVLSPPNYFSVIFHSLPEFGTATVNMIILWRMLILKNRYFGTYWHCPDVRWGGIQLCRGGTELI